MMHKSQIKLLLETNLHFCPRLSADLYCNGYKPIGYMMKRGKPTRTNVGINCSFHSGSAPIKLSDTQILTAS